MNTTQIIQDARRKGMTIEELMVMFNLSRDAVKQRIGYENRTTLLQRIEQMEKRLNDRK